MPKPIKQGSKKKSSLRTMLKLQRQQYLVFLEQMPNALEWSCHPGSHEGDRVPRHSLGSRGSLPLSLYFPLAPLEGNLDDAQKDKRISNVSRPCEVNRSMNWQEHVGNAIADEELWWSFCRRAVRKHYAQIPQWHRIPGQLDRSWI